MSELSLRARQILYAAVTEFVATGEPVGSRTLSKRGIELSPASIRNVLSDLEEAGFLHQPHTSAGRVPTDKAFRFFIDALMEVQKLSKDEDHRIRSRLLELAPNQSVLRETGKLLSELTGTAAVVVAPRSETLTLKHLRFIRTLPGELLAVLVMSNGEVQNRFLKATVDEDTLIKIHNLLDDVGEGRTLGELSELFARRLATERVQHDAIRKQAFELGGAAVANVGSEREVEVVIEGRAKLLEHIDFSDASGMKGVVSALDETERLVHLLDATQAAEGATVVVGREAGELGGGQLAIVRAAYSSGNKSAGSVAVIGPTRMDYPKVLPLVEATASAMTAFMGRSGPVPHPAGGSDDDDDG
ncbi:MAG: heat-inducible transcription repressor HrcA [Myxococcales bacterium]|jgi:heat-inducible transcriptional repressor|nr:heat-inducible transcription repressor HrcA [Myxococcales bacterium]